MELFLGILVAVALALVIMFFQKKKMKQAWQGTVTKIKEQADYYDDENNFREGLVRVYYQTDAGKKGKNRLQKRHYGKVFPGLKVGDHLVKETGDVYPKVHSVHSRA